MHAKTEPVTAEPTEALLVVCLPRLLLNDNILVFQFDARSRSLFPLTNSPTFPNLLPARHVLRQLLIIDRGGRGRGRVPILKWRVFFKHEEPFRPLSHSLAHSKPTSLQPLDFGVVKHLPPQTLVPIDEGTEPKKKLAAPYQILDRRHRPRWSHMCRGPEMLGRFGETLAFNIGNTKASCTQPAGHLTTSAHVTTSTCFFLDFSSFLPIEATVPPLSLRFNEPTPLGKTTKPPLRFCSCFSRPALLILCRSNELGHS